MDSKTSLIHYFFRLMSTDFTNIIENGTVRPASAVTLSPFSRLAMYGEGCFDTMRAYKGGFLRPEKHLERLQKGMDFLGLECPGELKSTASFTLLLKNLLDANDAFGHDVRLRIQVWADDDTPGYPPGNRQACFLLKGSIISTISGQTGKQSGSTKREDAIRENANRDSAIRENATRGFGTEHTPVTLVTSSYRRIPTNALPSTVKWSNGLNYILAARQACDHQADDTLMLTQDGYVSETTIANIFWKEGETVKTPSVDCDLLPGITRGLLITFLEEAGFTIESGHFLPRELHQADMVWACNSIREWYPIKQLDGRILGCDVTFWNEITAYFERRKQEELQYVR